MDRGVWWDNSPWSHKESDMTYRLDNNTSYILASCRTHCIVYNRTKVWTEKFPLMKERKWILLENSNRRKLTSRLKLSVCVGSDHAMVPCGLMEVCVLTHIHTHIARISWVCLAFVSASEAYLGSVSWEFSLQHCLQQFFHLVCQRFYLWASHYLRMATQSVRRYSDSSI